MTAAQHALRLIEDERDAREFLASRYAQQADPDELVFILATLYGATLRCLCRLLAKALGVNNA